MRATVTDILRASAFTALSTGILAIPQSVEACTRILYETGTGSYMVGRTMDWNDPEAEVGIWAFPRGLERDGGAGDDPIEWTAKYGSVIISIYDIGTNEGVNEAGLVANMLYLAESDYGDAEARGKPTISVGAWPQYLLDNFATVAEAVAAMREDTFTVIGPVLPNGRAAVGHVSLSDPSGDSAIIQYIDGELVIFHGPEHQVMTNSPPYADQLALNTYWEPVAGTTFLPGSISSADRFIRANYNLKSSPKYTDRRDALGSVFSQIRAISTPLGLSDPDQPNVSMTLWRSVLDKETMQYYFETALQPAVMWVDVKAVDLTEGSGVRHIPINGAMDLFGDVSTRFEAAEAFEWVR